MRSDSVGPVIVGPANAPVMFPKAASMSVAVAVTKKIHPNGVVVWPVIQRAQRLGGVASIPTRWNVNCPSIPVKMSRTFVKRAIRLRAQSRRMMTVYHAAIRPADVASTEHVWRETVPNVGVWLIAIIRTNTNVAQPDTDREQKNGGVV